MQLCSLLQTMSLVFLIMIVAQTHAKNMDDATLSSACAAVKTSQNKCAAKTCGSEPIAELCTDERRDPSPGCSGGGSCFVFPTYTCYAHAPNPELAKWEACSANAQKSCSKIEKSSVSIDQCAAFERKKADQARKERARVDSEIRRKKESEAKERAALAAAESAREKKKLDEQAKVKAKIDSDNRKIKEQEEATKSAAIAAAKQQADAREKSERAICLKPGSQGRCFCAQYYPKAKGDACGR